MDQSDQRNLILAVLLSLGFMFAYSYFVLEPQQQARRAAMEQARVEAADRPAVGDVAEAGRVMTREEVVAAETGAAARVAFDAASLDGSISLRGSRIDDLSLKEYFATVEARESRDRSQELTLLSPEGTERAFYALAGWIGTPEAPGANALWTQTSAGPLTETNPLTLAYSADGVTYQRRISVDSNYMFTIEDAVTNASGAPVTLTPVAEVRQRALPEHLKPPPLAHEGASGVVDGSLELNTYRNLGRGRGLDIASTGGWIGLTSKYWMTALAPAQDEPVAVRADVERTGTQTVYLVRYVGSERQLAPGATASSTTHVFAGAKRVAVLEGYRDSLGIPRFDDAVDWGFLWFFTKPFFWVLALFQGWWGSFGLAILGLTVVIKTLFFPIQFRAYEAMSKLRKLQPEMEKIRERFAADKQRQQQEMLKLYQREKANPVAGCLPLIPQMFVFYALYKTLIVTIEMRHTPFYGWVRDMSAPDPTTLFNLFGLIPWDPSAVPLIGPYLMIGVWPLLYGATMWALQGMSPAPTDPMQKAIMQWLPLIFLVLFAQFAAGLVIYWTWSNIITMVQQYIIMRRNGVDTGLDVLYRRLTRKGARPAE
jgi:YidC/Oxa1 family membrane protein insertase